MINYILALIALFFSTCAFAETYMVYNVTDNTRIVINHKSCLVPGLKGSRAVIQRDDGAYLQGCWETVDNGKHYKITWNNPAAPGDFAVIEAFRFAVEEH